jgi:ABC-type Na+ efflux pump permease subunit
MIARSILRSATTHQMRANPVLVKELRARFRGGRAFTVLTVFLILLAALAAATYIVTSRSQPWGDLSSQNANIGRTVFTVVALFEMLLVATIAPALASSAISGEVERRTFEMLLATPLTSAAIVAGKALSSMAYVLLLVASCLPILSLAFLFGGVSGTIVAQSQLSMLVLGFELVATALMFSSALRRTVRAASATYAAIVIPTFVAWVGVWFLSFFLEEGSLLFAFASPLSHPVIAVFNVHSGATYVEALWLVAVYIHTVLSIGALRVAVRAVRGPLSWRPGRPAAAWLAALAIGIAALMVVLP